MSGLALALRKFISYNTFDDPIERYEAIHRRGRLRDEPANPRKARLPKALHHDSLLFLLERSGFLSAHVTGVEEEREGPLP